jgi:hypothetical protein
MNSDSPSVYKNLAAKVNQAIATTSNLLVNTLPHLGVSYLLQLYLSSSLPSSVAYFNHLPQLPELTSFNILDLDLFNHPELIDQVCYLISRLKIDQKVCLVVNDPNLLNHPCLKEILDKFYIRHDFISRNFDDTKIFAREINPSLSLGQLKKIYQVSGGISRLIKFFSINPDKLNLPALKLVLDSDLSVFIQHYQQLLKAITPETLVRFQINQSTLVSYLRENIDIPLTLDIQVNADLTFSENGQLAPSLFTPEESTIVKSALLNSGVVTKEKIADIKWGEGSYDKFSDQAISASLRRLSQKLRFYNFQPIPKLGYKLVPLNES